MVNDNGIEDSRNTSLRKKFKTVGQSDKMNIKELQPDLDDDFKFDKNSSASNCVSANDAIPVIYKFMDHAYPDFGFSDHLSF